MSLSVQRAIIQHNSAHHLMITMPTIGLRQTLRLCGFETMTTIGPYQQLQQTQLTTTSCGRNSLARMHTTRNWESDNRQVLSWTWAIWILKAHIEFNWVKKRFNTTLVRFDFYTRIQRDNVVLFSVRYTEKVKITIRSVTMIGAIVQDCSVYAENDIILKWTYCSNRQQ